ncbi:fibrinogen c domain-containing protein 1-like [Plakobranchus ocellatus]|uniref:Fibrinogen c domain-containing protein 1-like n=1 Tax=Plakobranchus ocellatus TaxID=259542 RepID=A0AAV4DUS8_9GAST|nr:fibrinogen c domain-containing protein 1-like [Plakobranchus ocellatus]
MLIVIIQTSMECGMKERAKGPLIQHNGEPFSTRRGRDNDGSTRNCAELYTGAWWYADCHHSNLNGMWNEGKGKGTRWYTFTSENAATYTEMKLRRVISFLN